MHGHPVFLETRDYVNHVGILCTSCELVKRRPDGIRIRIQVRLPIKKSTYDRSKDIQDARIEIWPKDARRMFSENYKALEAA